MCRPRTRMARTRIRPRKTSQYKRWRKRTYDTEGDTEPFEACHRTPRVLAHLPLPLPPISRNRMNATTRTAMTMRTTTERRPQASLPVSPRIILTTHISWTRITTRIITRVLGMMRSAHSNTSMVTTRSNDPQRPRDVVSTISPSPSASRRHWWTRRRAKNPAVATVQTVLTISVGDILPSKMIYLIGTVMWRVTRGIIIWCPPEVPVNLTRKSYRSLIRNSCQTSITWSRTWPRIVRHHDLNPWPNTAGRTTISCSGTGTIVNATIWTRCVFDEDLLTKRRENDSTFASADEAIRSVYDLITSITSSNVTLCTWY